MLPRNALSACSRRTPTRLWALSRPLATEAAATEAAKPSSSTLPPHPPKQRRPKPVINTGIILNRSPLITREPTLFEQAYHAYQARIQRALFNPFPDEFYFKPGTILEERFKKEEEEREREAFGPPRKAAASKDSAFTESESKSASESSENQSDNVDEPMPRVSEADKKGDVRSLDRRMDRNLYLLVHAKDQKGKPRWRFPQGGREHGELLHEAAKRDLFAECGDHMDAWIVSRNPIGVYEPPLPADTEAEVIPKTYIFFYKAHILAGQVQPDGKNILDFAWLTKEELESRVDKEYWLAIKDILSDF
ncbi:hypothetical protein OBBRIDRAFT_884121 [Obba rivulosa]|uniref:Large ribosomal subunit protein mL46 n=1 Tax=Obba rivulosa TaxID=1052685 RepID=A0A8E2DTB1_9APHY|nr:hypothetical protein OBBRIDRAFT_884121 [Obba rivulosa]